MFFCLFQQEHIESLKNIKKSDPNLVNNSIFCHFPFYFQRDHMVFLSKYILIHQFYRSNEDYKFVLWLDEPMSDLEITSIAYFR